MCRHETAQALAFQPLHAAQAQCNHARTLSRSSLRPCALQSSFIQLNDCFINAAGHPEWLAQLALAAMVLGRLPPLLLCGMEALGELQLRPSIREEGFGAIRTL